MIEKLNIDNLFPTTEDYENVRLEYISEYQVYVPGGLSSSGYYKNQPEVARAKWERVYPNGFTDWREKQSSVVYSDLKVIEGKINELITSLEEIK